jgi:hypothetical protein
MFERLRLGGWSHWQGLGRRARCALDDRGNLGLQARGSSNEQL